MGFGINSPALHSWEVYFQDLIIKDFFKLDKSILNIEVWLIVLDLGEGYGLRPKAEESSNMPDTNRWDIKIKFHVMWQEF